MVYFIRRTTGKGPIKIGTTVCLPYRLDQLCKQYNCELKVIGLMEGGPREEKAAHRKFDHLRLPGTYRKRSEWFRPGRDLLSFIKCESQGKKAIRHALAKSSQITIPGDVINSAKVVAAMRDTGVEDVLWDILRPLLKEALMREMLKRAPELEAELSQHGLATA